MDRLKKHLNQWPGRIVALCGISLLACSCTKRHAGDDVPVIGLGNDGQSIVRYMPRTAMAKHIAPMMSRTVDLTTEKLQKYEANPKFTLTRVSVGLEIDPAIGIDFGIIRASVSLEAQVEMRLERLPLPGEPINSGS